MKLVQKKPSSPGLDFSPQGFLDKVPKVCLQAVEGVFPSSRRQLCFLRKLRSGRWFVLSYSS